MSLLLQSYQTGTSFSYCANSFSEESVKAVVRYFPILFHVSSSPSLYPSPSPSCFFLFRFLIFFTIIFYYMKRLLDAVRGDAQIRQRAIETFILGAFSFWSRIPFLSQGTLLMSLATEVLFFVSFFGSFSISLLFLLIFLFRCKRSKSGFVHWWIFYKTITGSMTIIHHLIFVYPYYNFSSHFFYFYLYFINSKIEIYTFNPTWMCSLYCIVPWEQTHTIWDQAVENAHPTYCSRAST